MKRILAAPIKNRAGIIHSRRTVKVFQAMVLSTLLLGGGLRSGQGADLNADWSDAANPNGAWSYNQGGTPLPAVGNWTPALFSFTQPAWAPSIVPGLFLPAWFKIAGAPPADDFGPTDWAMGDVIVHTTDDANGIGSGAANVTWTSPGSGTVNISGSLWNARNIGRSNHWTLYVSGVAKASGDLISGDGHTRATPATFAFSGVPVTAGQTVKLEIVKTSLYGDFVGVTLKILSRPPPPPPVCVAPPSGLVSWWTGDGNPIDIIGFHNGALFGGAGYGTGEVAQAFSFDGSTGQVQVPNNALWNFGSGDFTIDFWAKWNVVGSSSIGLPDTIFIGHDDGGGPLNKWFFARGGGVLNFHINDTSSVLLFLVQAPFTPSPGIWYHLAVTKAAGTYKIYVNGAAVGSAFNSYVIPPASAPLTIGQAENLGFMNGLIDEVEIFNRALSQAEITSIFNAGTAGKCKPLPDTTPPIITPTVTGTPGSNGWYVSNVTVSWSVTDPESGIASKTGCDPTMLISDTAGAMVTCSAVNGEGLPASNTVTIKIDKTPPAVTYTGNAGTYTIDQTVSITCLAADNLSGVASTTCANINGRAYSFRLGNNSFSANATDNAGNVGQGSTGFMVQDTPGGLANLTAQFVTDPNVASGLIDKLNAVAAAAAQGDANAKAGAINAFINQVNAQTGKSITAAQAAILIRLVQAL